MYEAPADVHQMACRPPLHLAVGSSGWHGGWPFRPLVGTTFDGRDVDGRSAQRSGLRLASCPPKLTVGWSGCPPADGRRGRSSRRANGRTCPTDAIFPKDVQSDNPVPTIRTSNLNTYGNGLNIGSKLLFIYT
jgi:hypothetical protein